MAIVKAYTLSKIDELFENNAEIKTNKARRNLIMKEWGMSAEDSSRLLGLWLNHRQKT